MNNMHPIEWREISASPVVIRTADETTVKSFFRGEDWYFDTVPGEQDGIEYIWFRLNQHLEGPDAMKPLEAIAPYVVGTHRVIMEKTDLSLDPREWDGFQKWIHYLFHNGAVRVVETRHYQWDAE